jgi:hypothetical protein
MKDHAMTNPAQHLTTEQAIHMALVAPEPFDQHLADLIDAEVGKWHPKLERYPEADERYLRKTFTDWFAGWDAATEVAARIVAERAAVQSVPSDEAVEAAAKSMYENFEGREWGPGEDHPVDEYYNDSEECHYRWLARLALTAAVAEAEGRS